MNSSTGTLYNISHPSGFSLESHIRYMEELYSGCSISKIDPDTMQDIFLQIKALQKKLLVRTSQDIAVRRTDVTKTKY